MPQGKLKVKTKMPASSKKKTSKKPASFRKQKPIAPKKAKHEEAQKLKKLMTKNVNETFESELRSLAVGKKSEASKKKEKMVTAEANKMPPKKKQPT